MTKQLHIISTGQQTANELINTVLLIHHEIDFVHIREKTWTAQEIVTTISRLQQKGIPREKIIVNDRIDIAHVTNSYGVQLAHHSINVSQVNKYYPYLSIGCSVHSKKEAIEKSSAGANYLIYGHIYETNSKRGIQPRGIKNLREIVTAVHIPVIAIGGITPERVQETLATGVCGIAVLSGILLAEDPLYSVKQYRRLLEKGGNG